MKKMSKVLMKGNEAFAESCIRAGCRFFSGYPITPQTEILEYMSWRMEEVGGAFIQTKASRSRSSTQNSPSDSNWEGTLAPVMVSQKTPKRSSSMMGMPVRLLVSHLSSFLSRAL